MLRTMVTIGSNGRFVIPAEFRAALGVAQGDKLLLRMDGDELRLSTPEAAIARAQAAVRRYVPLERSLVDELIEERRRAVERE